MSNVYQLPDLARMRAFESRVRAASDGGVADLICTEDGQWAFVECGPHLSADVLTRLVRIISAGTPKGVFELLGLTPTNSAT